MPRKIKANVDDAKMQECCKMHKKCMGWKMIVLGALVLANSYWNVLSWANFIGWIVVIGGVVKLTKPMKCCK